MMYKFKSRATGDVLMTQPVGERVLAIIGKPPAPQGIVVAPELVVRQSTAAPGGAR